MAADARAQNIVERVRREGFQAIDSLAAQFGVTAQTIRRDVNRLCDQGVLRRRHGGVDLPPEARNLAYATRQTLQWDAKRRIAWAVAAEIADGASLFLGIGTTPEQCALALSERADLRVMTNNLNAAMVLCRAPGVEIIIAGGRLRPPDRDVVGGEAHGFFAGFAVEFGIYGVGGVAEDGSLLDFSLDEVEMRQTLAAHCHHRFLVLDHSKFGRGATVRGGHISEASAVFTDAPLPSAIVRQLDAAGVRHVVCQDVFSVSPPLPMRG